MSDLSSIAIVGGGGLVSQCAAYDLASDESVDEILIADLDISKAKTVANRTNRLNRAKKARAIGINVLRHREASKAIDGCDLIVNGVQYDFNEHVMEVALEIGAHYLDFGGLYWMTRRQLRHNSRFRKAGLLAVAGMGAAPGLSGIMARELYDLMDRVDTIKVRDAWRDLTKGLPDFFVTWSIQTLMDEYTMDGEVLESGRIKKYAPLKLSEEYDFPRPVGKTVVYSTRHSEIATFPKSFRDKGVRNINWMEGGPGFVEEKVLADAGFGEQRKIKVGAANISPRRFLSELLKSRGLLGYPDNCEPKSFECLAVEVSGTIGGSKTTKRRSCIFPSKPEWKLGSAEYSVGVPGAIAARAILTGRTDKRGVLPPEEVFDPQHFYKELSKRGFRLSRLESVKA